MTDEPVLVDTSYWIEYFNRPNEKAAEKVEGLIRADWAALPGVVLSELLQGAKTAGELSLLRTALAAVRWVETGTEAYASMCPVKCVNCLVRFRLLRFL